MGETPSLNPDDLKLSIRGEIPNQRIEEARPATSFYQACVENQELYRQRREGHEMPRLSQKIETEAKRIFARYIAPNFPRTLISWNMLADAPQERKAYHRYETPFRLPEQIAEVDRRSYSRGIYALNEWATNYATRRYLEEESDSVFPKGLRALYAKMHDDMETAQYSSAYGRIRRIQHAAGSTQSDFSDAVFRALFQHQSDQLNQIIASQQEVPVTNLEELALLVGKRTEKAFQQKVSHLIRSRQSRPVSSAHPENEKPISAVDQSLRQLVLNFAASGYVAQPGIARVMMPINLMTGGIRAKFTAVHEAMHSYSASPDYIGLMPKNLIQPEHSITTKDSR